MRLLIGGMLIVLGFIFGVAYDQNMAIVPLQREIRAHLEEKRIMDKALDLCTKNKFLKGDYLVWAIELERRGK